MRQIHFIVSIKTVDNTPLFPSDFNGESFLLETTIKVSTQFKILTKGYSSFPTGLEAIICCSNISEAKKYADEKLYDKAIDMYKRASLQVKENTKIIWTISNKTLSL